MDEMVLIDGPICHLFFLKNNRKCLRYTPFAQVVEAMLQWQTAANLPGS
ncbi:MAG: hypothetical protein JRJ12_13915 [Deltaproteobacteria bacterium]|nr:hypothetical protein [Deltaproteobacteria bacterium]MBW2071422.1 hypothetical protein [Deltaproteobacteria bacterium]